MAGAGPVALTTLILKSVVVVSTVIGTAAGRNGKSPSSDTDIRTVMGPLMFAGSVPVMFAPMTAPVASVCTVKCRPLKVAPGPVMSCATPAASMIAAL